MSDAVAGSVVAKLGYDTTGLKRGEREAEQSLRKVDESLATTGKNTQRLGDHFSTTAKILGGLAGYKIAAAFTHGIEDSIAKASDLNETISKTHVIFGNAFDAVDRFAQGSATSIGLSRQAAEEAAATYGNLFVNIGIGAAPAAKMSTALVQLAGDLASLNNTPVQDALDALRSGLVGEVEPLRRYGVSLDDATLRQEALKLGLVATTKDALQPAVRAQAAYAAILDRTQTAQGDFARTSGGNANQLKILRAESDNAKAALGQGLLPVQVSLLHAANDLTPAMQAIAGAIGAIGSNDTARKTIEVVGGIAAAMFVLSKGIGAAKAIRDSEIVTLLRGTAARTASTAAIIAEGEAAAAATPAVAGLDAAEAAGGKAGLVGGASKFGPAAAGVALGGVGIYKFNDWVRNKHNSWMGPFYHGDDPVSNFLFGKREKPEPPDDGPPVYDVPYAFTPAGMAAQRMAGTQAALSKAHTQISNVDALKTEQGIVGGTFGGAFDVLPKTQQGDVSGATDKLATAQDRLKTAQDRLEQSQRRLTELRSSGKASTNQLADAEDRLAAARRNLDAASKNSGKAEDGLNKAKATTALSAQDLLGRVTGQAQHASGLASANNKLAAAGLSKPVIEGIDQLEKEAPGTIARVAAGLTPAMVKSLNAQFAKVQQAEHEFLTAPLRAAERAAKVENEKAAAAYAKSYADALAKHWADLDLPQPGKPAYHGKPPQGQVLTPAPADHEGRTAQSPQSNTYDLRGSTIIASDPTAMEAELARRARVSALAGRE